MDMPWDQPMFVGNGHEGDLHNAVLEDPWIHRPGEVAHALDASEARVKLPHGSDDPRSPGMPFLPPLIRVPVPVPFALTSYQGQAPALLPLSNPVDPGIPVADPIPSAPGTTRLLPPLSPWRGA